MRAAGLVAASALVLLISSGQTSGVPRPASEPPRATSAPVATIAGDPPAVTHLVRQLEERGLKATAADDIAPGVRIDGCLNAPYRHYHLASGGRLDVFQYADPEAARLAAMRVPLDADCGPIDYAYDLRYFRYGELIMRHGREDNAITDTLKVLEEFAGPAFACARGPGRDLESHCPD